MQKYLFIVLVLLTSQSVAAEVALKFTELKARLDKEVPSILKKHNAPGMALAFVKGDKLLGFLPYSYANVKRKTLIDETPMVYFAESAAAGLQTTAVDLARFTMAILRNKTGKYNGEQILAASFIDNMIVPAPNTDGNWSMSYIIDEENQNLGFAGFNRGWIAATRSMIDKNIGYVILANSSMSSPMRELDNLVKKLLKYQGVVDIE